MILVSIDLNMEPIAGAHRLAVWQRFLFHLVGKHHALIAKDEQVAASALHGIMLAHRISTCEGPGPSDTGGQIASTGTAVWNMNRSSTKRNPSPSSQSAILIYLPRRRWISSEGLNCYLILSKGAAPLLWPSSLPTRWPDSRELRFNRGPLMN